MKNLTGKIYWQVWDQVRNQVRWQVRWQVWNQVRWQVRWQVSDQVRDKIGITPFSSWEKANKFYQKTVDSTQSMI